MARMVIECRRAVPGSDCTMLFVGDADDVDAAFRQHVASQHQYAQADVDVRDAMQNAIFIGLNRAYIGDSFEQLEDGKIRIPGPGFIIRRFDESGRVEDAGSATLDCICTQGTGSCTLVVHGSHARCHNNTCNHCNFITSTTTATDPVFLKEDWLVDAPERSS